MTEKTIFQPPFEKYPYVRYVVHPVGILEIQHCSGETSKNGYDIWRSTTLTYDEFPALLEALAEASRRTAKLRQEVQTRAVNHAREAGRKQGRAEVTAVAEGC